MKNIVKFILFICIILFSTNGAYADFSFNNMELKFAQVSDSHISNSPDTSYKVLSHSKELLNSAISDLNSTNGLDFVVFTGDMVNEPTKEFYKMFFTSLSKLKYPSILVFGNHDALENKDDENDYFDKETVHSIIKMNNYYQPYDKPYFAYSPNEDYRVIVLDTTMGYEHQSNGYITDEQLSFLDNEINSNQDKVIIIFQHHPVVEPFKSATHRILNSNAYLAVLKKYEKVPIAIFAGHYHAAKIIRKGNVIHCTSPSLVTYPNAYRTIKVTNYRDRVIFNFNFHETKLKSVQAQSKSGIIAANLFNGASSDRNTEIMIRKGHVPKETYTKEEIRARKLELKMEQEEEKAIRKEEKAKAKAAKQELKQLKKEMKKSKKGN